MDNAARQTDFEMTLEGAKADALKYNTPVVVVWSKIYNSYEEPYNWCAAAMLDTLYPSYNSEYWHISAIVFEDGTVTFNEVAEGENRDE